MRLFNHCGERWSGVCYFGGGGGGTTTTTQTSNPWSGQQPALSDIYSQAQNLDQTATPQYFPGNTYAGLTPAQNDLIYRTIGYGTAGGNGALQSANSNISSVLDPSYTSGTSGAFGMGQNTLASELNPAYLNPWNSPSFSTVVGNTLASALPAATSGFINGGRADSGLATRAATMAATDAVGNLAQGQYNTNQAIQNAAAGQAANNYLTQQGNQLTGASLAPVIDQTQLGDLNAALGASGMTQTDLQNQIQAAMSRYNYNQMLPWNQLSLYDQAVQGGGSPGGTMTTQQPYFSNTAANVMGGVSAAASVAASIAAIF